MLFALTLLSALISGQVSAYDYVTYGDLGTFTDAPPWGNTAERPFSIVPDTPENVNTRFYLDTRSATNVEVYYDDMNKLKQTTFSSKKMTRFIIHGYVDNGNVQWMDDMSAAFLAVDDENIIRVGWFGGSLQVNYMSAAVDTQIVGATTAVFIENMMSTFGMNSNQFHCVGHSLGGQTCGYVGSKVQVGRVTGLDPAGPYFTGTAKEVRLDVTDAAFVDVIHTDAERLLSDGVNGFGTAEESGNIDYWPNGGIQQPGCDQNILSTIIGVDGVVDGTRDFVACNHIRAIKFFTESITTPCFFKSYPCRSYDEFLRGGCLACDGTGCPALGFHAVDYQNDVGNGEVDTFQSTNALSPFCEYMSEVTVYLGDNSKTIDGSISVIVYGQSQATEMETLGGSDSEYTMQPGGVYTDLVYYDYNTGPIEYVKVLWEKKELDIVGDYITVEHVTLFVGAVQRTFNFCGDTSVKMKEKTRYQINLC